MRPFIVNNWLVHGDGATNLNNAKMITKYGPECKVDGETVPHKYETILKLIKENECKRSSKVRVSRS